MSGDFGLPLLVTQSGRDSVATKYCPHALQLIACTRTLRRQHLEIAWFDFSEQFLLLFSRIGHSPAGNSAMKRTRVTHLALIAAVLLPMAANRHLPPSNDSSGAWMC